jgi:carbon monoxide dehydrogenase subunit G
MQITNSFDVPLPPDRAWDVLLDIRRIAPCMPGAELLEAVDANTFKGKVAVRLGPVALAFVGTAKFEDTDRAAGRARVKAQGTDSKGRGGASAVVAFALSPIEAGTRVDVVTDLNLSGAVAQYGRGSGMIQDVATQIIGQFAACLRTMLEEERAEAPSATPPVEAGAATAPSPPPAAKPISGFSLMARVLWTRIRRLFGAKA